MMVSLRLKGDLLAEIDRVAHANDPSRSAWMALVLKRAAVAPENDALPLTVTQGTGRADDRVPVTLRMDRSELQAIDTGHPENCGPC